MNANVYTLNADNQEQGMSMENSNTLKTLMVNGLLGILQVLRMVEVYIVFGVMWILEQDTY